MGSRHGRSFATNGPLLGLTLGGAGVGDELRFAAAQTRVPFAAHLKSIVAVDHLDLVCNGRVVRSFIAALAGSIMPTSTGSVPLKLERLVRAARLHRCGAR